jgi:undecaprenyl-diphosphatase
MLPFYSYFPARQGQENSCNTQKGDRLVSFLESLLYGLVSGIAEILPVSAQAHQALLLKIFGLDSRQPLIDLAVHMAVLLAIFTACYSFIAKLRRDMRAASNRNRRNMRQMNPQSIYDMRLLRTAVLPLCIGLFFYLVLGRLETAMLWLVLFWVINGLVLYVVGHMRHANKESRSMSGMDALLMGAIGALSAIPGISRIGMITSAAVVRGAARNHALNWALLLSIPALLLFMTFDVIALFGVGISAFSVTLLMCCIAAAAVAFVAAYLCIVLLQFLIVRFDLSGFSYYSWGIAMLSFILYLII